MGRRVSRTFRRVTRVARRVQSFQRDVATGRFASDNLRKIRDAVIPDIPDYSGMLEDMAGKSKGEAELEKYRAAAASRNKKGFGSGTGGEGYYGRWGKQIK